MQRKIVMLTITNTYMKKFYLLVAVLTAAIFNATAANPKSDPAIYAALPSLERFIQKCPPPEIGSDVWKDDSTKYFKYKEPRIKNEVVNEDSIWAFVNEQYYFILYRLKTVLNLPFIDVSCNQTTHKVQDTARNMSQFPEMNKLQMMCEDMKSDNTPGAKRTRMRPYCYFSDYYKTKHYDRIKDGQNNSESYPSGHGYFRGLFGKCMEIIDPENNSAIQNMMDEWLFCRLQLGAHWNTDIIAGQQFGEMAFDSVMMVDLFRNQVYAARKELKEYRGNTDPEATDIEDGIETYLAGVTGKTDFTIHRLLYKDGYFNTLCLPFSLTAQEIANSPLAGCELYAFVSATKNNGDLALQINQVTAIDAGTPYLIKWASGDNIISMTFNDVTITASEGKTVGTGDVQFVGIMEQASLTNNDAEHQLFLGANNTLHYPKANSTNPLKGFRAYFKVSDSANNTPARFVIRPNSPTAIDAIENQHTVLKRFENGQLIILRDGTKYNAQGQIVK